MRISDWKIIQIRNDLRKIRQVIERRTSLRFSLLFDLFLILLSFILDRIFVADPVPQPVWICIAIIGLLVPIIVISFDYFRNKKKKRDAARVLNTKDLVPLFDDEICYLVMSADSFYSSLCSSNGQLNRGLNSYDDKLYTFYLLEVSYYLNKSTRLLLLFMNNIDNVLDTDTNSQNIDKLSVQRFINVLDLIEDMYNGVRNLIDNRLSSPGSDSTILNSIKSRNSGCFDSLKHIHSKVIAFCNKRNSGQTR